MSAGAIVALAGASGVAYLLFIAGRAAVGRINRQASVSGLNDFVNPAPQGRRQFYRTAPQPGTEAFKIRQAFTRLGIDVSGKENDYRTYAIAAVGVVAGIVLLALFHSVLYALAGGAAAGFVLVEVWVASVWGRMRTDINEDLPVYFRNLAGVLKVNTNIVNAMDTASQVLDENRPLYQWVQYAVREAQGAPYALADLVDEAYALSPHLGMMMFQVRRYSETGGTGYTNGFRLAADGIAEMLDIKRLGISQAKRAYNLIYMFIALSVFSLGVMIWNPTGREMFLHSTMGRLALLGVFVIALAGYFFIRETIQEAVE